LKTTVSKIPTPHQSALFLFIAKADPDSVYWALNAFGFHSKKEEIPLLNPEENLSKNMANSGFETGNFPWVPEPYW